MSVFQSYFVWVKKVSKFELKGGRIWCKTGENLFTSLFFSGFLTEALPKEENSNFMDLKQIFLNFCAHATF